MKKKPFLVPLFQFRPGAVVEFRVGTTHLLVHTGSLLVTGPGDCLVEILSSIDLTTGMPINKNSPEAWDTIHVSHATRVVTHGKGEPVFIERSMLPMFSDEVDEAVRLGRITRRGQWLHIEGKDCWAPGLLRSLLQQRLLLRARTLCLKEWEYIDEEALLAAIVKAGIARYGRDTRSAQGEGGTPRRVRRVDLPASAQLNTKRLDKYLRQRFNHFKQDLGQLAAKLEAAEYRTAA